MNPSNQPVRVSPALLVWARETIGLSLAEVAQKINKPESTIAAWETGDAMPSFSQLEKLAYKIYKRPLAVFFLPAPPQESTVKQDFRTLPETDLSTLSPELRLSIRRAKFNQAVLKDLYNGKNPAQELLHKILAIKLELDVTNSAAKLRSFLGLDTKEYRSKSSAGEAFSDCRNRVQEKGVFVFQFPLKGVRGFSLMDSEFPVVVVNSSDAPTAKLFTLFHELCHILFNTGGVFRNFLTEELLMNTNKVEQFCNAFASEVLMPANQINDWMRKISSQSDHTWSEEEIRELASSFKVSKEVVMRRLLDLQLTDRTQYNQLVKRWNDQYRRLKEERRLSKGGPAYQVLVVSNLGKKFVYGVLESYHSGRLDVIKAAEFLGVKVGQVAKIENKLY